MDKHITARPAFLLKIISVILFFVFIVVGMNLAQRKPIWNDEIFTQIRNIDGVSYADIIFTKIDEGYMSPVYYLLQKGMCDLFHYEYPFKPWDQSWFVADPHSQFVLRLVPNILMSLSLAVFFYYFASRYSVWAGIYGLLTALSSLTVWLYWAEARPYVLWFLLSLIHVFILADGCRDGFDKEKYLKRLKTVHWVLAFSAMMSIIQIVAASLIVWYQETKGKFSKTSWGRYVTLTILPMAVCVYYYFKSPFVWYWLKDPIQLVFANIPEEYFMMFVFYLFIALYMVWVKRNEWKAMLRVDVNLLSNLCLQLMAVGMVLVILSRKSTAGYSDVPARIFIFLAPLGLSLMIFFSVHLMKIFKNNLWMRVNIIIVLSGIFILSVLRTFHSLLIIRMY